MSATRKIPLALRVDPAIKAAVEIAAKLENRTVTNLIETLIVEHCRQRGIEIAGRA